MVHMQVFWTLGLTHEERNLYFNVIGYFCGVFLLVFLTLFLFYVFYLCHFQSWCITYFGNSSGIANSIAIWFLDHDSFWQLYVLLLHCKLSLATGDGLGEGYGMLGQSGAGKLRVSVGQSKLAAKVAKKYISIYLLALVFPQLARGCFSNGK